MLKLIASAPGDGWAFVEKDKRVVVMRPPYHQWTLMPVPEGTVEKALQSHGFIAQELVFEDWDSLIAFLREQFLAMRRDQGSKVPNTEELRSILHLAPAYLLVEFLDRVEMELLPQKEWGAAMDLLTYLLGVEAVKVDSGLYNRTLQLLLESQKAKGNEEAWRASLTQTKDDFQRKFPQALKAYGFDAVQNLAGTISRRGQVFAFG